MKTHYGLDELGEALTIFKELLPLLIPIILIILIIMIAALINLFKKELPFNEKAIWLVIIILIPLIGPGIYFIIGSKMLDDKATNRKGSER